MIEKYYKLHNGLSKWLGIIARHGKVMQGYCMTKAISRKEGKNVMSWLQYSDIS